MTAAPGGAGDAAATTDAEVAVCVEAVLDLLPQVARFLIAEVRTGDGPRQLTPPQFRVLELLRRAPGQSLAGVAEHLGVRSATASFMVGRLVRQGLVRRSRDAGERRRVVLSLTDAGMDLITQARAAIKRSLSRRLADLSPGDRVKIAAGVSLLGDVLKSDPNADDDRS